MIYLISFPRSGNSWLRYCIENALGVPTIGEHTGKTINTIFNIGSITSNSAIKIIKSHNFIASTHDKAIFVLRHYNDCIASHMRRGCVENPKQLADIYMKLLTAFDKFNGKKILFVYNNITHKNGIRNALFRVAQFLDIDADIKQFFRNFRMHKIKSKNGYRQKRIYIPKKISATNLDKYVRKKYCALACKYELL